MKSVSAWTGKFYSLLGIKLLPIEVPAAVNEGQLFSFFLLSTFTEAVLREAENWSTKDANKAKDGWTKKRRRWEYRYAGKVKQNRNETGCFEEPPIKARPGSQKLLFYHSTNSFPPVSARLLLEFAKSPSENLSISWKDRLRIHRVSLFHERFFDSPERILFPWLTANKLN